MQSTRPVLNTRLSKGMADTLMEAHERLLLKQPPQDASVTKSGKGLILRGMMELKAYYTERGKKIMSLSITPKGFSYLKEGNSN